MNITKSSNKDINSVINYNKGSSKLKKSIPVSGEKITTKRNKKSTKPFTGSKSSNGSSGNFRSKGTIKSNLALMVPIFKPLTHHSEEDLKYFFTKMVETHNQLIINLGVIYGTKHYKAICQYCLLLCEGHRPTNVDRVSIGKVDKWPKIFGFLRPVYHSIVPTLSGKVQEPEIRAENLRLLQTLFKVNKVCSDYSELDVENLQRTFELSREWEDSFVEYLQDTMGDTPPIETNSFRIDGFLGNKKGPNGITKVNSAGMEAAKLLSSPLHKNFKLFCEITDNLAFYEYFLQYAERFNANNPNFDLDKVKLRKLVAVPDVGNKSRTVAICDVWTQMLLEPFEKVLKHKMSQEFSEKSAYFNHAQGFTDVNTLECRDDTISIDAEAWTDNFPARVQYLVVKQRFGQQFAVAWQAMAITCRWNVGNTDHTIKYGKGQGMGTKGSFMAASYSDHHVIEHTYKSHYGQILPYMKVGDDLVVTDPENIFREMYNSIGVPINKSKTKGVAPNGHFLEFVSRNSWNGYDYSAISAKLVAKTLKQPFYIPTLVGHLEERLPNGRIPTLESILSVSQEYASSKDQYEVHKASTIELMKVYKELSGNHLIEIEDTAAIGNLDKLRLSMILKIADITKKKFSLNSDSDEINLAEEHYSEFINNEYTDKWLYFNDKDFSLKDIELFNYFQQFHKTSLQIREAAMQDGYINNLSSFAVTSESVSDSHETSSEKHHDQLILACLTEAKCKLEGVKIIYDLSSSSPKNSRPMTELLKSLKQCLSESKNEAFNSELGPKDRFLLSTLGLSRLYKSIQDRLLK